MRSQHLESDTRSRNFILNNSSNFVEPFSLFESYQPFRCTSAPSMLLTDHRGELRDNMGIFARCGCWMGWQQNGHSWTQTLYLGICSCRSAGLGSTRRPGVESAAGRAGVDLLSASSKLGEPNSYAVTLRSNDQQPAQPCSLQALPEVLSSSIENACL